MPISQQFLNLGNIPWSSKIQRRGYLTPIYRLKIVFRYTVSLPAIRHSVWRKCGGYRIAV